MIKQKTLSRIAILLLISAGIFISIHQTSAAVYEVRNLTNTHWGNKYYFMEGTIFKVKLLEANDYAYFYYNWVNQVTAPNCANKVGFPYNWFNSAKYNPPIYFFDSCTAICRGAGCNYPKRTFIIKPSPGANQKFTFGVLDADGTPSCNISLKILANTPISSGYNFASPTYYGEKDVGVFAAKKYPGGLDKCNGASIPKVDLNGRRLDNLHFQFSICATIKNTSVCRDNTDGTYSRKQNRSLVGCPPTITLNETWIPISYADYLNCAKCDEAQYDFTNSECTSSNEITGSLILPRTPLGCNENIDLASETKVEACTYDAPICTYSYSNWDTSKCTTNGTKTKIETASPDGCVEDPNAHEPLVELCKSRFCEDLPTPALCGVYTSLEIARDSIPNAEIANKCGTITNDSTATLCEIRTDCLCVWENNKCLPSIDEKINDPNNTNCFLLPPNAPTLDTCYWAANEPVDKCSSSEQKISITYNATGTREDCISQTVDYPCSVSVKLPFFDKFTFLLSILGIALVYYIMKRK